MKWVYAAVSNHNEIVAFHKKLPVMKIYVKNYLDTNKESLTIVKMAKRKEEELNFHNLYLEMVEGFRHLYIQRMYLDAYLVMVDLREEELLKSLEEKLFLLLKRKNTTKEEITILEVLKIVKDKKKNLVHYTPTLKVLSDMHWRYQEYKYQIEGIPFL